ncbi:DUF2599 domain-containing protein [Carnobacterium maltaromaticum]|nr:DUF2599 domain-containing protein [Carnobacterium maltaromaticum]
MKMKKNLLFFVVFVLSLSVTPMLASAESENKVDMLPDGTTFTFGVPFTTNEFSDDGSYETVTIVSEVTNNTSSSVNIGITPRRIDNGYYIGRAYWINRNGLLSVSIYPNKGASGWTKDRAWDELKRNFSHYANWKNETSLRKQFNCHARPIPPYTGKIPWNLEPSKAATNILTCN